MGENILFRSSKKVINEKEAQKHENWLKNDVRLGGAQTFEIRLSFPLKSH